MITKDNNGELSCAALPQVMRSSSDIRHVVLAQDVPACLNGLLDIDLATQKEDLSFYPIQKAALQFHKSFQGGLVRDRNLASFFFSWFTSL